jgi:hypothetical protein
MIDWKRITPDTKFIPGSTYLLYTKSTVYSTGRPCPPEAICYSGSWQVQGWDFYAEIELPQEAAR